MRITELTIKNYRSFDPVGQIIKFPTAHCALVGKNNAGKSNIFSALNLVLGAKNPAYIKFEEDDYFDINFQSLILSIRYYKIWTKFG
jgi:putative ATP-dependent endonuclease of OLD family